MNKEGQGARCLVLYSLGLFYLLVLSLILFNIISVWTVISLLGAAVCFLLGLFSLDGMLMVEEVAGEIRESMDKPDYHQAVLLFILCLCCILAILL